MPHRRLWRFPRLLTDATGTVTEKIPHPSPAASLVTIRPPRTSAGSSSLSLPLISMEIYLRLYNADGLGDWYLPDWALW